MARAYVAGVWGVDPDSLPGPGPSAYELIESLGTAGGPRVLLVHGTNLAVSSPRGHRVAKKLAGLDQLIVCDIVMSETAALADVVLPVAQWAEEEGTMTNLEGRGPKARGAIRAAGLTDDWSPASESSAEVGLADEVAAAFRGHVVPVCVGPVTAARLERMGIATVQPIRSRLGAMVREIVAELPTRCRTLKVAGHIVQVRGHAVVVDGIARELAPAPMAVMAELARRPGVVVSRSGLLTVLPGGGADEHAVQMTVTRLRGAIGSRIVQTVVKRGYRLAYEPESSDDKYGTPG